MINHLSVDSAGRPFVTPHKPSATEGRGVFCPVPHARDLAPPMTESPERRPPWMAQASRWLLALGISGSALAVGTVHTVTRTASRF